MAVPYRISIDEAAVASYIKPGGEVYEILFEVTADTKSDAQAFVRNGHVRSGRLLKGIQSTNPKSTGALTSAGEVRSTARHSLWFHDGVDHDIAAKMMLVPKHPTPHMTRSKGAGTDLYKAWAGKGSEKGEEEFFRTKKVRGQSAKPFLRNALSAALAKQGLK